ncbi:VPLPA-CTERM sorting domain-containing protein [uncultured Roseobacter sp.]|uniref:VPLPA-CTERM sorting domain-containing protein n=1 Tax=uncultured Roseobacter sp. TaxID=114847 RepID=UPI002624B6BE|nr:VPLPA-CTERM sorting domain-containing protein [uncultured Roseobacter sp.]
MSMIKHITAAAVAVFAIGGTVQAATVDISKTDGSVQSTDGLTGYTTSGADMDGMRVTAGFLDGNTSRAVFGATGRQSGAAEGDGFSLSLSGFSTFSTPFELSVSRGVLTWLQIDALPGDTVFDTQRSGTGTPGSANGTDFTPRTSLDGTIPVLFSNILALRDETPAGDLYGTLRIGFDQLSTGGLQSGSSFSFVQDTDNLTTPAEPLVSTVPVPAGLPLVLTGLAAFGYMRHRRSVRA